MPHVHCRTGSLEKSKSHQQHVPGVHCRTGSSVFNVEGREAAGNKNNVNSHQRYSCRKGTTKRPDKPTFFYLYATRA
ncbi:hypothetical protein HMPREF0208_04022 [Citrobacter koseri]|nr:hypothetical protein HMPREF3207_01497 [Citrobacter koseri]KXB40886.1 hypothetical protein HMPREF0208_04022 [Citrobacter koseri]